MLKNVDSEMISKYFFYGLDKKEEVIKRIIENKAVSQDQMLYKEESRQIDLNRQRKIEQEKWKLQRFEQEILKKKRELENARKQGKIEDIDKISKSIYYLEIQLFNQKIAIDHSVEKPPILYNKQLEEIMELVIQLERFTTLNDHPFNKKYVFNDRETEKKQVKDMIEEQLQHMVGNSNIFYINYAPMSGIFYKKPNQEEKGEDWMDEVISVLEYFRQLEKTNLFQYYSTFLDVKYARAIHRRQNNIVDNDDEINENRKVYRQFLKRKTSFRY